MRVINRDLEREREKERERGGEIDPFWSKKPDPSNDITLSHSA